MSLITKDLGESWESCKKECPNCKNTLLRRIKLLLCPYCANEIERIPTDDYYCDNCKQKFVCRESVDLSNFQNWGC